MKTFLRYLLLLLLKVFKGKPSKSTTEVRTIKDVTLTDEVVPTYSDTDEIRDEDIKKIHGGYLWHLDAGHGKMVSGKRSPKFPDGTRLLEWEFNRDVVQLVSEGLKGRGISYNIVVPENIKGSTIDVGNILKERVNRVNSYVSNQTQVFLSIHANAFGDGVNFNSASGIETWVLHGNKLAYNVASKFQSILVWRLGWKNRGIKSKPEKQFYVLRNTNMLALLLECGFYTNFTECSLLRTDEIKYEIANSIITAIVEVEQIGLYNV